MDTEATRGHDLYQIPVAAMLAVVLIILLATMQSSNASQVKQSKMDRASRAGIESVDIPPIDAAVPPVVKTASFGLG